MAKLQKGINDLKTWCLNNGEFGKQLMQEWTGELEDGGQCEINEISFGSTKRFKWRCSKGHEWFIDVVHRTIGRSCPYCAGKRVSDENSLKTWCLNNGEFGKQLIQEWTGELENGNHCEIDKISFGTHTKAKWRCSENHEWYATINSRTAYKRGCPRCNHQGTSYPEQFIYWSLKQLYPNTENRCRVLKSQENPQGIEFDIGVPEIPLCIEYSPTRWHDGKQEIDGYKKELCKKANVSLIQIIEDSYDELEHSIENDYICFKMIYSKQDEILVYIVDHILKLLGHSISEIDLELVKKNAWDYSKGKIEYEKSLASVHPRLAEEWHPTLNVNIKPNEVKCGSNKTVYWQCAKCMYGKNGEWNAIVASRTYQKSGCPNCGYNWSDDKTHKTAVAETGVNDLQSKYPELAKEWHPTLNTDLKLDEIRCGSNKTIYWQCKECNYGVNGEWKVSVNKRTYCKLGCPNCGYNWSDGKIHKKAVAETGINDLQSKYPELAKEWHPTLNTNLKPDEIKCGSNKKVYWQCIKCGHGKDGEWQAPPVRRTAKGYETGCPKCGHNWYKAQQGQPQKYKGLYSYLNDQENT